MKSIGDMINDNERFKKPFNIDDIEKKDPFYADKVADWLVEELGPGFKRRYGCKVARYISRAHLAKLLVTAKERGDKPVRLFCFLCEKELRLRGVSKYDS